MVQNDNDGQVNKYFLGKMISPSITPGNNSQPGFTTMTLGTGSKLIENVKMTFLQLESAHGLDQDATYDQFEYLTVDWDKTYGLTELSSQAIADLNERLTSDDDLLSKYLANKTGYATGGIQIPNYSCWQMNSMYLSELTACNHNGQDFDECDSQTTLEAQINIKV